jgi:hypothetical protein
MFYAMSAQPQFWKERLNLFVALAPVTRLHNTTAVLFKYMAQLEPILRQTTEAFKIYSLLGKVSNTGTKIMCGMFPQFCKLAEGFFITQDPTLDDTNRF